MAPVRRPPRTTRTTRNVANKKPTAKNSQPSTVQSSSSQDSSTQTSSSQKSQGICPQLLNPEGNQVLRLGVDFGSGNSSCEFVIVEKDETNFFEVLDRVQALHTLNESIRFPTVVAIEPWTNNAKRASLVFADEATKSLHQGDLSFNMMFYYQKLGLIDGYGGIFASDRSSIQLLHERHNKALKIAAKFDSITVQYPGSRKTFKVTIDSIEDVIVQTLKYFLALVKNNIRHKLKLDVEQIEEVFQLNTEVGFAAPTFWKDAMLDNFLHLVEEAGWPKRAKVWSEPKCALAAHVVSEWMRLSPDQRSERRDNLLKTAMVVMDIGAGSLDATSARVVEVNDSTIKLATIAESSGSLCGGYLLNTKIKNQLKHMFGSHLPAIQNTAMKGTGSIISTEDFMQNFSYDKSRHNFGLQEEERLEDEQDVLELDEVASKKKLEYPIEYGPRNLPTGIYENMTFSVVKMSFDDMAAAHDKYLERILHHVDEQLTRTRREVDRSITEIQLILVGGVTRAPYIVKKIEEHITSTTKVRVVAIEEAFRSVVAIGCVLFMGQNNFGGRYRSKEAYGIPVAEAYNKKTHGSKNCITDERTDKGEEARDLADWIVKVGDPATEYSDTYEWTFAIEDVNGGWRSSDPRKDPAFSLTMTQQILSTSHPVHGATDLLPYRGINSIDERKVLNIEIGKEQCHTIERNKKYEKIGFWRDPQTGHWFFICDVRIVIDWPDMRVRWRAEIPKSGAFEGGTDEEVWQKEVFFTSINNHGVEDGDEAIVSMDTSA